MVLLEVQGGNFSNLGLVCGFMTNFPSHNRTSDSFLNIPLSMSVEETKPLVLVLSGEEDTRFLFRTLLEMWDFRVEEAATITEAIRAAERRRPSLVLMDTIVSFPENMTRMRELREADVFSRSPIVLISGYSQPRYRIQAISSGADDFLVKPVDFDLLKDCLDRNIEKGK